jgi:hypothetical protein
MPLGRYFAFVGSALLALLFLADWYMPKLAADPARADVDRTTIRIHARPKWPEAVIIDTSLPTIVPPPMAAAVAARTEHPPEAAFALARPGTAAQPPMPEARTASAAVKRKRVAERRQARPYRSSARIAGYPTVGFGDAWYGSW